MTRARYLRYSGILFAIYLLLWIPEQTPLLYFLRLVTMVMIGGLIGYAFGDKK